MPAELSEAEDADEFNATLHALVSSAPKKFLFDPGTAKKTFVAKGCFNPIIYGTCFLENKGCKNLHDKDSLKAAAKLLQEKSTQYLSST